MTYITRSVMKQRLGRGLDDATVAVQGFGNVGSWTAKTMHERGARIVAISDKFGGIYNSRGIDLRMLQRHVAETGTVIDFNGSDSITNEELLTLDVDVLVPAALEGQITKLNAHKVRADDRGRRRQRPDHARGRRNPAGQGHPGHPRHHLQRRRRGRLLLRVGAGPAVLLLERRRGAPPDGGTLLDNLEAVIGTTTRRKCTMRTAAYIIAIERIEEAMRLRGFYP